MRPSRQLFVVLALTMMGAVAPVAPPALAATELVRVDVVVVASGYRTTELVGRSVYNDKSDKIGTLDDIIISTDGNALSAILQVGGFLGIGGRLVAVPYKSLVINDQKITLRGATKEALGGLQEFKYSH
jgi:sporulation protein YlmC with PRC-barrel domain